MNISWKDTLGVSSLVIAFTLILASPSKEKAPEDTASPQAEASPEAKKKSRKNEMADQRQPQSQAEDNFHQKPLRPVLEVKRLIGCYYSESCQFPSNDPREYKLSVGQALKKILNAAYLRIEKREEANPTYWKNIAIETLAVEDGHVKEASLNILSTQEPDERALVEILREVLGYHDPHLVPQAMAELQKYTEPDHLQKIYAGLAQVLQTGSLLVRKEVLNHLDPYLNEKSLPYFENALQNLNPKSSIHSSLYRVINEYKRQKSGA
ncbi:MAG: hypothetical protein KDD33_08760 [Bdellovibrionales bacterium]|nr:hypothetical protein [Bdellovibrionales bacterium]